MFEIVATAFRIQPCVCLGLEILVVSVKSNHFTSNFLIIFFDFKTI